MVISGCVGPRGDGYDPGALMSPEEARGLPRLADRRSSPARRRRHGDRHHHDQRDEAIGIARAARAAGVPVAISFTVETDGRLPTGESLGEAIAAVDAATGGAPAYYMINCAHPTHFARPARRRTAPGSGACAGCAPTPRGAATRSSTQATDLDDGDPVELGGAVRAICGGAIGS